jgi:hypothetical protein
MKIMETFFRGPLRSIIDGIVHCTSIALRTAISPAPRIGTLEDRDRPASLNGRAKPSQGNNIFKNRHLFIGRTQSDILPRLRFRQTNTCPEPIVSHLSFVWKRWLWETSVETFRTIAELFAGKAGTHVFLSSMRVGWQDHNGTKKECEKPQRSFAEGAVEPRKSKAEIAISASRSRKPERTDTFPVLSLSGDSQGPVTIAAETKCSMKTDFTSRSLSLRVSETVE